MSKTIFCRGEGAAFAAKEFVRDPITGQLIHHMGLADAHNTLGIPWPPGSDYPKRIRGINSLRPVYEKRRGIGKLHPVYRMNRRMNSFHSGKLKNEIKNRRF
jgi:hypothetical protein